MLICRYIVTAEEGQDIEREARNFHDGVGLGKVADPEEGLVTELRSGAQQKSPGKWASG